jgi:ferredoxin
VDVQPFRYYLDSQILVGIFRIDLDARDRLSRFSPFATLFRRSVPMSYIIVEPCINVKDRSCVDVCPVDCIYEGEDQLYIHPDECIDCGACEPECPVTAIFPEEDVPPQWKSFIAKNKDVFQSANPPGKPSPERGMK